MEENLKKILKTIKLYESNISLVLGILVVLVSASLIVNYFSEASQKKNTLGQEELSRQEADGSFANVMFEDLPTTHTVSAGEHLWLISERYYGTGHNWIDIAEENGIGNFDVVTEGRQLTIPKVLPRFEVQDLSGSQMQPSASAISVDNYTTQEGDTLWSIAVRAYQDGYQWPKIYDANIDVIIDPDNLEGGLVLKLPR